MKNFWFNVGVRLHYLLTARHRRGFGVHSPFVFHLLNHVVFEREAAYYCYEMIEQCRDRLLHDMQPLVMEGFGTSSARQTTVAAVARQAVEPVRYAQLLFRLALSANARHIVELGTNLGLTAAYLSKVSSQAQVTTFEGEPALCRLAQQNFEAMQCQNIRIIQGDIDAELPRFVESISQIDFAFFDANHTREATLRYYALCKSKAHDGSVFVFDDIHWSPQMQAAWQQIVADSDVHLSIDLFRMGLVWFRHELPKQHYVVAF